MSDAPTQSTSKPSKQPKDKSSLSASPSAPAALGGNDKKVDKKAEKAAKRAKAIAAKGGPSEAGKAYAEGRVVAGADGKDGEKKAGGEGKQQQQKKGGNGSSLNVVDSSLTPSNSSSSNVQSNNNNNNNTKSSSKAALAPLLPLPSASPTPHLIVSHLPPPKPSSSVSATLKGDVHPSIIKLGLQLKSGAIRGANARCIAGLLAFKNVILAYRTPQSTTLPRDLTTHLSPQIAHLTAVRAMPVGLGNAIRWLKYEISTISIDEAEADSKRLLAAKIDEYIKERITLADEVIVGFAKEKIRHGDVVLTYARSSVVEKVLIQSHREMAARNESFSVIVVDSAPLFEGKALLTSLISHHLPCTYALLSSLPSLLPRASLVLLGTNALFSNGALYSRAGTASVAMMSKAAAVSVVVCCETYKFGEKIQLDAVVANEMGDPNSLLDTSAPIKSTLQSGEVPPSLQLVNLLYDLTPPNFVTAVCTEYGMMPPSAVPTVLSRNGAQSSS